MSEHQVYDFRRLDGTLTPGERAELRAISTRAEITGTRFRNEYHWGDLSGSPRKMVEKYFDAFFYVANWGTRWLMFRFPSSLVPLEDLKPFELEWRIEVWEKGGHTILSIMSREDEYLDTYYEYMEALDDLVEIRAQIIDGDFRALFMIWLDEVTLEYDEDGEWSLDEDDEVAAPPIPAGLGALELSLMQLAEIYLLDMDVIEAAAKLGPSGSPDAPATSGLDEVLDRLTVAEKDDLLRRVVSQDATVRTELVAAMREERMNKEGTQEERDGANLTAIVEEARRVRREREALEQERRERKRLERERRAAEERAAHLAIIASRWEQTWDRVYGYIDEGKRKSYARAAELMNDLIDAADGEARREDALARVKQLREMYSRRSALMQELDLVGLP